MVFAPVSGHNTVEMSERTIQPNDRFFVAAKEGGPFLVIAAEEVRGFQTYQAAEQFAGNLHEQHTGPVTLARVIFKRDGTPYRMKAFPTVYADSSFERARREFGL